MQNGSRMGWSGRATAGTTERLGFSKLRRGGDDASGDRGSVQRDLAGDGGADRDSALDQKAQAAVTGC